MIDLGEFEALRPQLEVRNLLSTLPATVSEDDVIGILRLALLTECATDTFAAAIEQRAARYGASWLRCFTRDVWAPDERTHAAPYKAILQSLGFAEAELDRDIRETREQSLEHQSGDTPMHLTSYGMLSEYATEQWHGAIARMLKSTSPAAAYMANRIKRRETLHRVWYRDMTALQIEGEPGLVSHLAEVLLTFRMPGASLLPELQSQAGYWMTVMGYDFKAGAKELVRIVEGCLTDVGQLGRLLVNIAAERGEVLGPISANHIRMAFDRLGGRGYGLVGEALLESVGLSYLAEIRTDDGADRQFAHRLRRLLRSWLAGKINLDLGARTIARRSAV
ncbi:MAG: acyl-ACP desaturase [Chloroflexota bacterium]